MKLRTKLTAILMCLCTLLLCLTMGFVLKGVSASADTNAPVQAPAGENPESWTKVPESQMKALSNDPTTFSQLFMTAVSGTTPRFRYTPSEGENYTLSNVTDIAFRIRNSGRYRNSKKPNGGLTYIEFKFKENDTVWNLKNQPIYTEATEDTAAVYTHLVGITPAGGYNRKIGIAAAGSAAKGGMFAFPEGMDTTVYIPLTFIYNDDSTRCITSVAGYENWTLEYIEFEQSYSRWDLQIGQIALVQTLSQADSDNGNSYTYPQTVMNFTKSEIENTNGRLAERAYDNVRLTVNNTQATLAEGKLTAAIEGIGSVSVDPTLLWYTSASITSDLAEGYGITGITVQAFKAGEVADVPALTVASIEDGYTFALSQSFRKESTISNDQLWADTSEYGPIEMSINITVEKLVKLTLTGDMADYVQVTYGSHTAQDGVLYLASDVSAVLTVVAKSGGGTLTGVKLGGEELTPAEGTSDYTVRITEDTQLEVIGVGDPATVTVDLEKATHTGVSVDGTAITEGKEISTNEREVIVIVLSPETGYRGILEKVVTLPSAEEDEEVATAEVSGEEEGATDETGESATESETVTVLVPDEVGGNTYTIVVDGNFTLRVSDELIHYTITYRANGGTLNDGDSNPETLTVLDTAELKFPVREGYTFLGWYIVGKEGQYVTELSGVSSDLTLVAAWERNVTPGDPSDPSDPTDPSDPSDPTDPEPGKKSGCGAVSFGGWGGIGGALLVLCAAGAAIIVRKKKE